MNVTSLLADLETILKDTAAINTYCNTKYSKLPTIFVGMDIKDPLDITDLPALALYDFKTDRKLDKITYSIAIGIAVGNNEIVESSRLHRLQGFVESKELKELLECEICARLGKVTFIASALTDALFPIFTDVVEFSIEYIISKRSPREPL